MYKTRLFPKIIRGKIEGRFIHGRQQQEAETEAKKQPCSVTSHCCPLTAAAAAHSPPPAIVSFRHGTRQQRELEVSPGRRKLRVVLYMEGSSSSQWAAARGSRAQLLLCLHLRLLLLPSMYKTTLNFSSNYFRENCHFIHGKIW